MIQLLPFIVVGLAAGSLYGLAAIGMILTVRTTGIFNVAYGAVGMFSAYSFYWLKDRYGWSTVVLIVVVVGIAAPLVGAGFYRGLLRRLRVGTDNALIVVPIGLLVALQGLAIVLWAQNPPTSVPILPQGTFSLPGVIVGYDQLCIVGIGLASLVAVSLFLRLAPAGIRMRSVVDDDGLAELFGINSARTAMLSWMIGFLFASIAGILLASNGGLDINVLSLVVVQVFGAAAIGRFRNLVGTYVGALAIGVAAALATKFVASAASLQGLPSSIPFIVLFIVLAASPRGSFRPSMSASRTERITSPRPLRRAHYQAGVIGVCGVIAIGCILPAGLLLTASTAVIFLLVFTSLRLVIGWSREISLSHIVFVALGATNLAHFTALGLPFPIALVFSGLALVPVGAALAAATARLSGVYFSLATLGFGVFVEYLVYETPIAFGAGEAISVPRGLGLSSGRVYFAVLVVVASAGVLLAENVIRCRIGRLTRAAADSAEGLESIGISSALPRVIIFCISACLAGIAGGLLGSLIGSVTPLDYDWFTSLTLVAVLVTTGAVSLRGSIFAAVGYSLVPGLINNVSVTNWLTVAFGLGAITASQFVDGMPMDLSAPISKIRESVDALLSRSLGWRTKWVR